MRFKTEEIMLQHFLIGQVVLLPISRHPACLPVETTAVQGACPGHVCFYIMALYGGLGLLLYQITTKLLIIILNMRKKSTSSICSQKVICAPVILSKMKHKMYQATKRLQLLRIFKINIYFIFLSCWERWFNPFFSSTLL